MTKSPATTVARRPRLLSESSRSWVALGAALVLVFLGLFALIGIALGPGWVQIEDLSGPTSYPVIYLGYWILYCLLYLGLTYRVFRRVSGSTLRLWLAESAQSRRRRRRMDNLTSASGPTAAVSFASVALVAVVIVAVRADLRSSSLVLGLSVVAVACSWMLATVAYTLHYAREYVYAGGLEFPQEAAAGPADDPDPTMGDFFYLAVQVGTTFSTSDVAVVSRSMRQTVTSQSLVAFTFNSVIVALLVSLLLASV